MELKGLSGNFELRKVAPNKELSEVVKATENNGISEIVVKSEKGVFVVSSADKKFAVEPKYLDKDGLFHETNLSKPGLVPTKGNIVNFGELKGEVLHVDEPVRAITVSMAATQGAKGGGMILGGIGLAIGAIGFPQAPQGIIVFPLIGAAVGAAIGGLVGAFSGGVESKFLKEEKVDSKLMENVSTLEPSK